MRLTTEFVRDHQVALWRYLRFLGAPPSLADDLTQETFLTAFRHPPEDRGDAAAGAWLRVTARRLFFASRRSARFALRLVPDAELEDAWSRLAGDSRGEAYLEALEECMTTLDADDRQIVRLKFGECRSRELIGSSLSMSVEGVKSRLRRIKERLRICVARRMNDEC